MNKIQQEAFDAFVGQLAKLIGGKITAIVHTPEDEEGNVFWGFQIKVGKKEKTFWILSDFEGNFPGAWDIEDEN